MERVFVMPDLGEGLEEGTIVEWLVAAGDEVALNQPLVEVETAKATVEIPSPFAGTIATLHGGAGEDVPVGAALVTFDVEGEAAADVHAYSPRAERPRGAPARATPPVRKLAKELGVDIQAVKGSGPEGRVTDTDVRRVATRIAQPPGVWAVTVHDDQREEQLPVDPMRGAIAETLSRQASIPQVTTFRTVDCTGLEQARRDAGVSPLPIFVAAVCATIADHPLLNATWREDAIVLRGKINVGIAVDTDAGLTVPVLQDAGRRGVGDLTTEIKRLADAARSRSLQLDDIAPTATIAVSNTGSYGSEAGTPILSPGTAVTLALGAIQPRALVVDGQVVARPAATISLTFDHRVLDGATAGRALTDLVALLESPERLGGLPR
jgi:pyruvate dehydrogenase E2 component (dihydrolipoamide acetyltransferase)